MQISFAVKRRFEDMAPTSMVKLEMHAGEPVVETTRRMRASIDECRADAERPIDREIGWVTLLPAALLSRAVGLASRLDAWNLMPPGMMRDDPLFASMFLANLGSVGIDRAFHHLYEYGTGSIFGAVGVIKRVALLEPAGGMSGRDTERGGRDLHGECSQIWRTGAHLVFRGRREHRGTRIPRASARSREE